jgi:two-component system sensor histidine kinase RstB
VRLVKAAAGLRSRAGLALLVLAGAAACHALVGLALARIYGEGRHETDWEFFHLMHGPAVMIEAELRRAPPAQWPQVLARLQPQFDYELRLKPIDQVKFMPTERLRVLRGEIARGDEEQVDTVHYRIRDTDLVLAMGPIWVTPVRDDYLNFYSVRLLGTLTLLVLLAFPLVAGWLWLAPSRRGLRALHASVRELADGATTTRTAPVESRLLAPLAAEVRRLAVNWHGLVESQRELSRAVSHELRTPVARLRFGLALLDERARSGNERVIESLERSLADLEDLVECSLIYARYTQARPVLDLHERALLGWVREELAPLEAAPPGPVLHVAGEDGDAMAAFDPGHMKFALRNLVINALRFAAARVDVHVACDGIQARIDVDDDGPGVAEADRTRIFEPFVRGRQPDHRAGEGHGLGLSIAARVADWHGGRIELARSPANGARFSLVWPVDPSAQRD